MAVKVLLVDDHDDMLVLWRMYIERSQRGLQVVGEATSGIAALDLDLVGLDVDVYVVDYMMPGMTGIEFVEALRSRGRREPVILCSAYINDEVRDLGVQVGVQRFLDKDAMASLPDLIEAVAADGRN